MKSKLRTKENLRQLSTEQTNSVSQDLDRKSALQIVRIINSEDAHILQPYIAILREMFDFPRRT